MQFIGRRSNMTMNKRNKTHQKILLRACPRCHGDLFPDIEEEDFACLQCGRRIPPAQLMATLQTQTPSEEVPAAA
jgi:hypothetical protein